MYLYYVTGDRFASMKSFSYSLVVAVAPLSPFVPDDQVLLGDRFMNALNVHVEGDAPKSSYFIKQKDTNVETK